MFKFQVFFFFEKLNFKFCNIKLYIKNKFNNRIVNNIRFEQKLTCVLRTKRTCNKIVKFSKFTSIKKKENLKGSSPN